MSTLKADTIVAADGTSPVTLTKQSAAKAWVRYDGAATSTITSSFNFSSVTDNATTGDVTFAFANSMADADYLGGAGNDATSTSTGVKPVAYTASTIRVATTLYNAAAYDSSDCCFTVFGDLA